LPSITVNEELSAARTFGDGEIVWIKQRVRADDYRLFTVT